MKHIFLILILTTLFSCETHRGKIDTTLTSEYTAFTDITLINGTGTPPKQNMVILLKGDLIHDVGKLENYVFPKNTKKINSTGKYTIPGLIDTHAHVTVLPFDKKTGLGNHYDKEASITSLQSFLAFGVTTVRNVATPTENGIELRNIANKGNIPSPRVFTSGYALNKRSFGPFKSTKTTAEVKAEIRKQVDLGVDVIKVYSSLEPKLIKAAIDEAHRLDVPVIGHLQNTTWTEAAEYGIDFITHAANWNPHYLPKSERNSYSPTMLGRLDWIEKVDLEGNEIQTMLDKLYVNKVSLDPTLIAFHTKFWANDERYTNSPNLKIAHPIIQKMWRYASYVEDWKPKDFARAQKLWRKLTDLTKRMHEKGILLTTGSDFPNPWILPGISLHQEMELLSQSGISNIDVIKIATFNGAKALKIANTHGTIERGKIADIIILNADPLVDIKNTLRIDTIIKKGSFYTTKQILKESF